MVQANTDVNPSGRASHPLSEAVGFLVQSLRQHGCEVSFNAAIVGLRSLLELKSPQKREVKLSLRTCLIHRSEDLTVFDRVFEIFWEEMNGLEIESGAHDQDHPDPDEQLVKLPSKELPSHENEDREEESESIEESDETEYRPSVERQNEGKNKIGERTRYSPSGTGSAPDQISLAQFERDELNEFKDALSLLPGRRRTPSNRGRKLDLRRMVRKSFQTGGAMMKRPRRDKKQSNVKCVIFMDVSRSVLECLDRSLILGFIRDLHRSMRRCRTFFFDTHCQEVTGVIEQNRDSEIFSRETLEELRWGGGTRIGEALKYVRKDSPGIINRNTGIVIVSDGLDRGDTDILENEMIYFYRRAGFLLWLNPLASSPEYEPICRGMRVSLPFIDGLFAFSRPGDLAEIARQIKQRGLHGKIGFEHDIRQFDQFSGVGGMSIV